MIIISTVKKSIKGIIGSKRWIKLKTIKYKKDHPDDYLLTKSNSKFKNIHKGKRCFILGNGPSLNKLDFSLLKNEITFTVNQLPRNPNFRNINTNYHIWSDERFFDIDGTRDEDVELLNVMKSVKTAENNPIVFFKSSAINMIKKYNLDSYLNIRYYNEIVIDDLYAYLENGINLQEVLPVFTTVIGYAICIAIYMGFSEIYLLGCDCTGFISTGLQALNKADESLYAYNITSNEKTRMERVIKQTKIADELRWYVKIFDNYDVFEKYSQNAGIIIKNAGIGGLLESFERVELNKILKSD